MLFTYKDLVDALKGSSYIHIKGNVGAFQSAHVRHFALGAGAENAGMVTIWDKGGLVVEDLRENEKILFVPVRWQNAGQVCAHQD